MNWLVFSGLVISGFAGCIEFGAFLLVYPVIRRFPDGTCIEVQQKLSRRRDFALSLPSALIPILLGGDAFQFTENSWANRAAWGAVFCFSVALAVTILWHNPITRTIAGWNPSALPPNWKPIRVRWHITQGVRGFLQFVGFSLFCFSIAIRSPIWEDRATQTTMGRSSNSSCLSLINDR